ncbi:MAG TPA: hypothetical protein VK424_07320 [Thermoplasmata archaeon]|nr:hypothetical protein [Thermoplasmata archaeon]
MDRHASNAYLQEVLRQARIGLWSFEGIRRLSAKKTRLEKLLTEVTSAVKGSPSIEQRADILRLSGRVAAVNARIVMNLQSFLAASGVISAIFWPNQRWGTKAERRMRERRGRELRFLVGMPEKCALRYVPGGVDDTRGGLLHVDEIIDDAVNLNPGGRIDTFVIGRFEDGESMLGSHAVRAFDETGMHLFVGSRDSDLRKIALEMYSTTRALREENRLTVVQLKENSSPGGV